jgi:hypothetical protein
MARRQLTSTRTKHGGNKKTPNPRRARREPPLRGGRRGAPPLPRTKLLKNALSLSLSKEDIFYSLRAFLAASLPFLFIFPKCRE